MKKFLSLAACLTVIASLAIGGTVAYLTDTDEAVNVMTLGNVDIEQNEQQRVNNKDKQTELEEFEQGKPLFPAVYEGSSIPWAPESEWVKAGDQAWKVVQDNANVIDKFVTVKNTGKSDAYVRTIIAFEENPFDNNSAIHIVTNTTNVDPQITCDVIENVTIDGVQYTIGVYTYPEKVAPGETTIPSLKQVYMGKEATNEDVAKFGNTYDVLVLSQAVQAAGFKDAETALNEGFGEVTADNAAKWFGDITIPTTVSTAAELKSAIKNATSDVSIVLTKDIEVSERINVPSGKNVTLDGGNHTLTANTPNETMLYSVNGSDLNISNLTIEGKAKYAVYNQGGDIVMSNVKIDVDGTFAVNFYGGGNVTLNDCEIVGEADEKNERYSNANVWVGDGRKVTVNGGMYSSIFVNASSGANILSAGSITVNDGTINKLILETEKNKEDTGYKSATLTQNGGTITALVENPQNYDLTGLEKLN